MAAAAAAAAAWPCKLEHFTTTEDTASLSTAHTQSMLLTATAWCPTSILCEYRMLVIFAWMLCQVLLFKTDIYKFCASEELGVLPKEGRA